jgi:hypothetical protein
MSEPDTILSMKKIIGHLLWGIVSVTAAFFLAGIAIDRGEPVNSFWLVLASVCTYLVGFRFYGKFIAAKVMALNDKRATPAERLRDGRDFEPTNKWILFGHHFAAIAGPGPLVGPMATRVFYTPALEAGVPLSWQDGRASVVQSLGEPSHESWLSEAGGIEFLALAYPRRRVYVILMSRNGSEPRYIGAMSWNWRPLHAVELPGGGSSLGVLRNLQRF